MRVSEAVTRILERLDVDTFREAWPKLRPGQPAPKTRVEAIALMHAARLLSEKMSSVSRRESHKWLTDHGISPPIPFELLGEPPVYAGTSMISVNANHPEIERSIYGAMRNALLDSEALGDPEPVTRERMQAARHRERRALGLKPLV